MVAHRFKCFPVLSRKVQPTLGPSAHPYQNLVNRITQAYLRELPIFLLINSLGGTYETHGSMFSGFDRDGLGTNNHV